MSSNESNKPGRPKMPNRQGLYAKVAKHAEKAMSAIVGLLNSRNEAIQLGAAKALLDKCLPDIKAVEMKEENNQPIKIMVVAGNGFIPPEIKESELINGN